MYKAFKYRLSPNKEQEVLLSKHFGHCRLIWNLALEARISAYSSAKFNYSRYDLQKQLVDLKKEFQWLKEVNSQSLQSVLINLDIAYNGFFNGSGFPKFKSKHDRQSFYIPQNVKVDGNNLIIPKFTKKGIKVKVHRKLEGKIKSATISRTPTGKYFVSILCETGVDHLPKLRINDDDVIGIDLGIKHFAVTSVGEVIENPKYLRNSTERLKVLQRRASKKKKGSSNRNKANMRVSLLHEKINNKRRDFLHKVSIKLIRDNQTIALETLVVRYMVKGSDLSQAIHDASWSTFVSMMEYKAEWYGVNIIRIDRFAPSSKTCECGVVNKDLKLSDRIWECKSCGRVNERDLLAANNIKKFALSKVKSGQELPVEPVELSTLVGSVKQEVHPIAFGVVG